MTFPLTLALTGAEFSACSSLPKRCAWMACHYSCYTTGLSNCPDSLPDGAMLILNDRTPPQGHDPQQIAKQLSEMQQQLHFGSVLLDFQRPGFTENTAVTEAVIRELSCPVGVSSLYAGELECPVFLPPPPLHLSLKEHFQPWQGREIWLEGALDAEQITVTEAGSHFSPLSPTPEISEGFDESKLHCRYRIKTDKEKGIFTLVRTTEHLNALWEEATALGVKRVIGLYQELGRLFPQI